MTGYDDATTTLTRGRRVVNAFDRKTLGDARANDILRDRLEATATSQWPSIRDRYAAATLERPMLAQPGVVVAFENVRDALGQSLRADGADLAFEVDGVPIVATLDPDLKSQYAATLKSIDLTTLPQGTTFDLVAVVDGPGKAQKTVAGIGQRHRADHDAAGDDAEPRRRPRRRRG